MPWGLPDGLGLILGISMVAWWPWPSSTTSLMAMTILTVGSFACLPWVVRRWRLGLHPRGLGWFPMGAAAGLILWSIVSTIFSGAPWPVSLYGWEGRQDGLLALIGVGILLVAAASLRHDEIERVITWLLLAGGILVAEAMLQLVGWGAFRTSDIVGIWAAMANPNFLGAMCGMLAALALARVCDRRYAAWQRVVVGGLLAGLAATAILTLTAQGPVTLVIAVASVLALRLLQWRGPQRVWVAIALAVTAVGGVALTVLGLVGVGPLTRLWDSESTGFRKTFWDVALRIMEARPIFGTGPGGLARYVGEFRSEDYIRGQGIDVYIDAAHNVPLQYGATIGVLGLVLAILLFGSALVLSIICAWRSSGQTWLIAGVGAMLAVYVSQSLISIDELRLKEMGWLSVGLVIALVRSSIESERTPGESSMRARWLSPVLAALGLAVCVPVLWVTSAQTNVSSLEEAKTLAVNPALACDRRINLVSGIAQVTDLKSTWSVAGRVADLDSRCPGLAPSYTELAALANDGEAGLTLGRLAVETDPLNPRSWLACSLVLARLGSATEAQSAFDEAVRLQGIRPLADWQSAMEAYERNRSVS